MGGRLVGVVWVAVLGVGFVAMVRYEENVRWQKT